MEKNAFPHAMLFIVGCVMVRTDKTEYMVMQVRGWGPRAGNLATWKNNTNAIQCHLSLSFKSSKDRPTFCLTDGTNYYIGGY